MKTAKRELELDLLRILSLLAVMVMHARTTGAAMPADPFGKLMIHAIWASVTWCVPCFVMISGRFFLDPDRNVTIGSIFRRSLPRIVLAFVFWSAVYQPFFHYVMHWDTDWHSMFSQFLVGAYHMWYLFLIAGLYLIAPLLRPIAREEKLSLYFVALFLLMNYLTEYGVYLPHVSWALKQILEYAHVHLVLSYSGYFLLGWVLYRTKLPRWAELSLYALGLAAWLLSTFGGAFLPVPEGEDEFFFQLYMRPNVVLESAALYCFFVKRVSRLRFSQGASRIISLLSELNFGMYLSHILFLETLVLFCPGINVFLWVPIEVAIAFLGSAVLTWILKRIPLLRKVC